MQRAGNMIYSEGFHDTGGMLWRYGMDHYLKSGSQVIHILKTLAYIGLQHVHLS